MSLIVLIADCHFLSRFGLKLLTREVLGNNTQIDLASDEVQVSYQIERKSYDILICDINLPGMDCFAMMRKVLAFIPGIKILLVSPGPMETFAYRYIEAGAYGFISKSDSVDELKKALRYLCLGKRYFPASNETEIKTGLKAKISGSPFDVLSNREFTVMILLLKGIELSEIAQTLTISSSTASTYKARIFEKLLINNLIDLSKLARTHNIIV